MFGIESTEILSFGRQLGLALAGAAALWGFVFTKWSKHRPSSQECLVYEWLGTKILLPFVGGSVLFLASWLLLSLGTQVFAHEGIALEQNQEQGLLAGQAAAPVLFLWLLSLLFSAILRQFKPAYFSRNMEWFYLLQLGFMSTLMMAFSWHGEISRAQFFFWGHALHSIMTLGTVLVLDFLFLISKSSAILKQHIYPLFPPISKVIWVGLGIDFLSVALVFEDAIALTPKFFFMQTIVAILIINGALLAGPIAKAMLASIKQGGTRLAKKWERIGDIAGVVSIASWGTITLVDSFGRLTLTYLQLFGAYLVLLLLLFLSHLLFEYLRKEPPVVPGLAGA